MKRIDATTNDTPFNLNITALDDEQSVVSADRLTAQVTSDNLSAVEIVGLSEDGKSGKLRWGKPNEDGSDNIATLEAKVFQDGRYLGSLTETYHLHGGEAVAVSGSISLGDPDADPIDETPENPENPEQPETSETPDEETGEESQNGELTEEKENTADEGSDS